MLIVVVVTYVFVVSCRADWTFLDAPLSEAEMVEYCARVPGPKMVNMLEGGVTPIVSPSRLQEMGKWPLDLIALFDHYLKHHDD